MPGLETFKLNTTIYVSPNGAQEGVNALRKELEYHGWAVVSAEVTNPGAGVLSGGGFLAVSMPFEIWMQRPGAALKDAKHDLETSITKCGLYSVVGGLFVTGASIGGAIQGGANDFAADPDDWLDTLKFGAAAVIAVAAVIVVVYTAPVLRTAVGAARGGA